MNEDVEDRFKATKVVKLNSILVSMLSNLKSITKKCGASPAHSELLCNYIFPQNSTVTCS